MIHVDNMVFEKIKEAFSNRFENFELTNKPLYLEVRFQNIKEGDWFYSNICYPKDIERKDYPVECLLSMTPHDGEGLILNSKYFIAFRVENQKKLLKMLA